MTFSWQDLLLDEAAFDDTSVHDLFARGARAVEHASELPRDQADAQAILRQVLRMLQRCDVMIDTAGLFSDNEDKDDIATSSLRFLLVEHLTAEVLSQSREQATRERLMSVALACRHHRSFLKRLQQFDLLPQLARAVMTRLEDGEAASPQVVRNEKLELKRQDMALQKDVRRLRDNGAADADDSNAGASTTERDEEAERELWVARLHLASIQSLQALGVLSQEQEMLAAVLRRGDEDVSDAQREAEEREREETEKARAAMKAKLLEIAGGLSSARDRQQVARDVFKPGHILPTISVEQQGMIELREAQERQQREAEQERRQALENAAKGKDQLEDEALDKQRKWDDWKDEHPTGYGNSKLRPCAL